MRRCLVTALVALNLALVLGAPQNEVQVSEKSAHETIAEEKVSGKVYGKGDTGSLLDSFQSDQAFIRTCLNMECKMMTVGDAKALAPASIQSVQEVKGNNELANQLAPTLNTMTESLKGIEAQKALLKNLEQQMAAMANEFNKGQQLNENAKGQFAETITKGISFAAAPPSKGAFAAPPSKGGNGYANMQLEGAMCPMTMYELGKSQKLSGEIKTQLDGATLMNAQLMNEKRKLETGLTVSEMMRQKVQQQADFNAKFAAEQKSKAELLEATVAMLTAEKTALEEQKAKLEADLESTQSALAEERETNKALTDSLKVCNEEKDTLNQSLSEQTARAEAAEAELASTKESLEAETNKRIECEESLKFTEARLAKSEEDLNKERAAREQTEEELMKTMTDLSSTRRELSVTSETLSRVQDELQDKTQALARESAAREAVEAKLATTTEQLRETEANLRSTQRALEDEQNAHGKTQRRLDATIQELEATEAARKQLEEAKQQLEDELAETKSQLEAITAERDELKTTLDATSAALNQCSEEKAQCQADLTQEKATTAQLASQLNDAIAMLQAEKKAREDLANTILTVKAASEKIQEEVRKLQLENLQLQAQVQKLKAEQEAALAVASGCPPTYEKFGVSCYKYVREKTPWKMAQEQCMKDSGNLVSVENKEEQIFLVDYLRRHGAEKSDAYAYTSGNKQGMFWKWLGSSNNHVGATGEEFWYNQISKAKPGYDCMALYFFDGSAYGKWVGLPCYNPTPYVCEYSLLPPGTQAPPNPAESEAMMEMANSAPIYLKSFAFASSKGGNLAAPAAASPLLLAMAQKGQSRF